jgi:hypothetical protein
MSRPKPIVDDYLARLNLKRPRSTLYLFIVVFIHVTLLGLLVHLGPLLCQKESRSEHPVAQTSEAREILDDLNLFDREALDTVECPDRHPGVVDDGEIGAWIFQHQDDLRRLGYVAKWNRKKTIFELEELPAVKNE